MRKMAFLYHFGNFFLVFLCLAISIPWLCSYYTRYGFVTFIVAVIIIQLTVALQ
jgi:hypothetical protein